MSENSLKSRNKFVNKVVNKLNNLKDDLELLYKVDKKISRKIFKNINNQSGGSLDATESNAKNTQLAILRKQIQLQDIHNNAIIQARNQLESLEKTVIDFNDILYDLTDDINEIMIKTPESDNNVSVSQMMTWSNQEKIEALKILNEKPDIMFDENNDAHVKLFNNQDRFEFIKNGTTFNQNDRSDRNKRKEEKLANRKASAERIEADREEARKEEARKEEVRKEAVRERTQEAAQKGVARAARAAQAAQAAQEAQEGVQSGVQRGAQEAVQEVKTLKNK